VPAPDETEWKDGGEIQKRRRSTDDVAGSTPAGERSPVCRLKMDEVRRRGRPDTAMTRRPQWDPRQAHEIAERTRNVVLEELHFAEDQAVEHCGKEAVNSRERGWIRNDRKEGRR
jgi:hypothetical protein